MKTAVVTLSVGREGAEMLAVSRPFLKGYALRLGAAFHEIRVDKSAYPVGEKFRVRPVVEHYDRTIFLDADVLLDPATCPDLFAVVPADRPAAHEDYGANLRYGYPNHWFQQEHDELCDSQGVPRVKLEAACNSGVMVLSRQHAPLFDPPTKPFPRKHCMEQWWIYVRSVQLGFEWFWLPEAFNYQWWFTRSMPSVADRPDIHIRHFAATSQFVGHRKRIELMRATAVELMAPRHGRRCLHLLSRTEYRAGCGGWNCAHGCGKGLPAVPGGFCQTCPRFEDDGPWR